MNKIIKNIFILLFLLIPINVFADEGFIIDGYNIDITINRNNSFDVTEKIYVDFLEESHGIIRTLPIINNVCHEDFTCDKNITKLSDVSSNMEFKVSKKDNNYEIKIGDKDVCLNGSNEIIIKYNYAIGNDSLKNADEVYYNLIGNDWNTTIRNVNFRIQFPDNQMSNVGFSSGFYGEANSDNVEWTFEDEKTIVGSVKKELIPGQGLTIRATLPDNYFSKILDFKNLTIITLLLIIGLWSIAFYIKDRDSIVETVEFFPPEGMNGLDCQALLSLSCNNFAVMSLLFTLANKGYLTIEDNDTGYKIHKIKDYDGYNDEEEMFMKGLFLSSNSVTNEDIEEYFYYTVGDITRSVLRKTRKWFATPNKKLVLYTVLLTTIWILLITAYTTKITVIPILTVLLFHLIFYYFNAYNEGTWLVIIDGIAYFILYIFVIIGIGKNTRPSELIHIVELISFILIIMNSFLTSKINRLKKKYMILKGKIIGFKNFLITVRKDELEALVEDNPNYFYDILPYTMAMGISDVWVLKFKDIGIPEAEWYRGTDINRTKHKVDHNIKNGFRASRAHNYSGGSSSRSYSSGGRSTGGGFSGGGSGGGGGRSW